MSTPEGSTFVVDNHLPARRSLRVAVVTETCPPEVNGVAATAARVIDGPRQQRGHTALAQGGLAIRHGANGLLAALDDTAGFCALARRLSGDLRQARTPGAAARETAARMDWERIVEAVKDEYLAAMAAVGAPELPGWKAALPAA